MTTIPELTSLVQLLATAQQLVDETIACRTDALAEIRTEIVAARENLALEVAKLNISGQAADALNRVVTAGNTAVAQLEQLLLTNDITADLTAAKQQLAAQIEEGKLALAALIQGTDITALIKEAEAKIAEMLKQGSVVTLVQEEIGKLVDTNALTASVAQIRDDAVAAIKAAAEAVNAEAVNTKLLLLEAQINELRRTVGN